MPCVCNENTADPVVSDPVVSDPVSTIPVGNETISNVTVVDALAPTDGSATADEPLTVETLQEDFPDIWTLLEAQEAAPLPIGEDGGEEDGDLAQAGKNDKKNRVSWVWLVK